MSVSKVRGCMKNKISFSAGLSMCQEEKGRTGG